MKRALLAALAWVLLAVPTSAQWQVPEHSIPVGRGSGTGFTSAACTSAQLLVGQTSADPICRSVSGNVTISSTGVTAIGSLPSGVFANPSASIGFSANNGSAVTAMRSDGTPALAHTLSDAGPTFAGLATVYNGLFVSTNSFPVTGMFGSNTVGLAQAMAGGIEIPSSANFANHSAGVAGYARTASTANGAVGVYGQATVNGSGTSQYSIFGGNFVATNTNKMDDGTNTGFNAEVYGVEIDINLKKRATVAPSGNVRAIYVQNNGAEIQPTGNFNGVEIDGGGTVPWKSGFYTSNGSATAALTAGAATTGSSASSQTVLLKSTDSGGSTLTSTIFSDSSGNIQFFPAGSGALSVNGNIVVSGGVKSSSATLQATPSNPTGTSSATQVMMGVGGTCKLTPVAGTRIKLEFHVGVANGAVANASTVTAKFGTGTAPTNGAAVTGTSVGTNMVVSSPGASFQASAPVGGVITGLTPGTQYWFDVALSAQANTSTIQAIDCNAIEF